MPALRDMGHGEPLGTGCYLQGMRSEMGSEEIRSRNGNGKPSLSCVNTLVAQIERVPEETIPEMQISPERPPGDELEPIVKLLLEELGVDVESQHFRETPARVARFYREFMR